MMGASEPKSGEWSEPAEIAWDAREGSRVGVGSWKLEGGVETPRTE
jgi:hypothetical protein